MVCSVTNSGAVGKPEIRSPKGEDQDVRSPQGRGSRRPQPARARIKKDRRSPMSTSTITESPNPTTYPATPRTTLKRLAVRGRYDRAAVHAVLDEALVCHVAFVADGSPVVIPVAYARIGDDLYLHGSTANRMLRTLAGGGPASIAVTLLDGLVLARSAFHHSVNYRSVVVFGTGERVTDPDEHARARRGRRARGAGKVGVRARAKPRGKPAHARRTLSDHRSVDEGAHGRAGRRRGRLRPRDRV